MQSLLSGDPGLARRITRDLWGPLPAAPVVVALTDAASARGDALAELLELRAEEQRGSLFFGRGDDGLVLVVPADDRHVLQEAVARFGARLGVSALAGYDGFAAALDQARVARDRGRGDLTDFADVAASGVLSALGEDARALAEAELAPLTTYDAQEGTAVLETLAAWLDSDCSHEKAARALGVHRHTVRTRLALAERLLARDLGSFAVRAELWAALQVRG